MRLVAGTALVVRGFTELVAKAPRPPMVLDVFAVTVGVALIAGLWTPFAASLAGVLALVRAFSPSGDPWACIFLAAMAAALAMLGPGAWSLDARLFGWKRIAVRDRRA